MDVNKTKQEVTVKLQSIIEDGEEKEYHAIEQVGYFFHRDGLDVLTFTEMTEDNDKISHMISIYPDRVNIKRSGAVQMNQQFQEKHVTESVMKLPHGNIHMEIDTKSITYQSLCDQHDGELVIHYSAKLNGQAKRDHQLRFTYSKEVAK